LIPNLSFYIYELSKTTTMNHKVIEAIMNAKKVILVTSGRNGAVFLHSLFDSHSEILTIPTYVNWPKVYDLVKDKSIDEMVDFVADDRLGNIFHKKNDMLRGNFENFEFNIKDFKSKLKQYLLETPQTSSSFFESVHAAYAVTIGQDINKIKVVLSHHHMGSRIYRVLEDFPESLWINIIRHPVAAFHSQYLTDYFNQGGQHGFLYHWVKPLNVMISQWMNFEENLVSLGSGRYIVIKLEDLHEKLEETMRDLAVKMDIKYDKILLKSTLAGHDYIASSVLNKNISGANKRLLEPKFKKELSNQDIRFVETFARKIMDEHKYPLTTKADMSPNDMQTYHFRGINSRLYDFFYIYKGIKDDKILLEKNPIFKIMGFLHIMKFSLALKRYILWLYKGRKKMNKTRKEIITKSCKFNKYNL